MECTATINENTIFEEAFAPNTIYDVIEGPKTTLWLKDETNRDYGYWRALKVEVTEKEESFLVEMTFYADQRNKIYGNKALPHKGIELYYSRTTLFNPNEVKFQNARALLAAYAEDNYLKVPELYSNKDCVLGPHIRLWDWFCQLLTIEREESEPKEDEDEE